MRVPLLDLKKQYEQIKQEIKIAVDEVFESQVFIGGPKVDELEMKLAEYCGCKYAVAISSGTDALLISLMAAEIGYGDLVITSPYTFFATAGSIARVGAVPVFVDIDEDTYNIDPDEVEKKILSFDEDQRKKLKAIIPVHLYGQCADMERILEIAAKHNLIVIEDAAQAIGAEYRFSNGEVKRAGSMSDYGCFSFYPTKNLGAFGEGGMVTCNEERLYIHLKTLRNHGDVKRYIHHYIGGNFRLDAVQAAVLLVKLKYLDEWTDARINNAMTYRKLINEAKLGGVILPVEKEKRHIYHQFVIKAGNRRDALLEYLRDHGVGCEVYYPVSLHEQKCFEYLKHRKGDLPVSEKATKTTLALPVYPELTGEQQNYVVDIIGKFFNKK